MAPVFEHPAKESIEKDAESFFSTAQAKVVKGKDKPAPQTTEAEVETKG